MKFKITLVVFLIVALSALSHASASPEDFLRGLYRIHVARVKKNVYWFDNKKELGKYFDKNLTSLFLKDEECKERTHEICNLDFDPLLDAQDFDEKYPFQIKIEKVHYKTSVRYKVMITNVEPRTLVYDLKETPEGWRITDITFSSGLSLKKILSIKP